MSLTAVQEFPEGFFFIRSKFQSFAIDVNGGSMTNDANIIIWPQKMVDSINQLWMHEEGFLINKKSGLVLDIRGGSIERNKMIIQYARKPGLAHNQRWTYKDGYIFPTTAPHLVLDIKNSEFKNGNTIFLNAKNLHSSTQQWIIQPFEDEKSKAELALLRPSPLQRNSTFPRQDELHDCYRQVYLEGKLDQVTLEQLAGAAAFKGMKDYIYQFKQLNQGPIVANETSRHEVMNQVKQETLKLLSQYQIESNSLQELVQSAISVAESYFSREYGNN
ncbi:MAG: ricin B lectin domain-containing protein [Benjaminiella poitrasii]|nr:MAG: ricin B lectin domain-containing protein [Benjaminiella poitrasii]